MGYNLYTDADTLFDTRYELIRLINQHEANKILRDGSYHNRTTELYGNITWEMFKPLWDKRTKMLLKNAVPTGMFRVIRDQYLQCVMDPTYTDVLNDMTLYVNIYPYKLTEEEKKHIEETVARVMPNCSVYAISKSWEELTANWMVTNMGYIFMYSYMDWINYQITTGNYHLGLNRIEAYIPGVVRPELSSKADAKDVMALEEKSKMFAKLSIIDVAHFCLRLVTAKPKKEEES